MKRTIIHITIDQLTFDRLYQRAVDPNRVRRLAAEWDPSAVGAITVSLRRDGTRVIVDGQHRVTVARSVGYQGKIAAVQLEDLTPADEASLFLRLNNTKQVHAIDKFVARVIAEDKPAMVINGILSDYGWTVRGGSRNGYFGAVAEIEKVYNGAGVLETGPYEGLVAQTIGVITAAYGKDSAGVHQSLVAGVGQFLARFGNKVEMGKLINEMSKVAPRTLIGKANALRDAKGGTAAASVGEVITGLYNKGRRVNRLPDWRWSR